MGPISEGCAGRRRTSSAVFGVSWSRMPRSRVGSGGDRRRRQSVSPPRSQSSVLEPLHPERALGTSAATAATLGCQQLGAASTEASATTAPRAARCQPARSRRAPSRSWRATDRTGQREQQLAGRSLAAWCRCGAKLIGSRAAFDVSARTSDPWQAPRTTDHRSPQMGIDAPAWPTITGPSTLRMHRADGDR